MSTLAKVIDGSARWCVVKGDNKMVLPKLAAKSVDHVITDPPYSEHVHGKQRRVMAGKGGRKSKRRASGRGFYRAIGIAPLGFESLSAELRLSSAEQFARVCRRWCLVFSDAESCGDWRHDLDAFGLRHVREGAWVKLCAQPQLSGDRPGVGHEAIQISHPKSPRCRWNGGGHSAIWSHAIATDRNGNERHHTTQKPLDLFLRLIEQFTNPDDVVLDPFCGSGTTGVACLRLGRRFIGIEKDAKYAAIARDRLAAEGRGLSLSAARAGQTSIFDAIERSP